MEAKWMKPAQAEVGTREVKGAQDNPRIIAYRKAARCSWMKGSEEAVPWCAIFVNAMLEGVGVKGTASPAAKSFCSSTLFQPLPKAALGAIVVIERVPAHPSLGHVGFCVGADKDFVWLLGGNQGDAVNIARFARSRVKGFYWPVSQGMPSACGDFRCNVAAVDGGKVV